MMMAEDDLLKEVICFAYRYLFQLSQFMMLLQLLVLGWLNHACISAGRRSEASLIFYAVVNARWEPDCLAVMAGVERAT